MDYPEFPLPGLNDHLIMQIAMRLGFTGTDLDSINRYHLFCCCIFLSDLASANGKFLDPRRGLQGVDYLWSSAYDFPKEQPSDADWAVWQFSADREPEDFWEYLKSWGGERLWEHVYTPFGLDAVVEAMDLFSAVYITDGSYSCKIRSEIDAGYMIYCKSRRKVVLKGSFYELCHKAGSYRGELWA